MNHKRFAKTALITIPTLALLILAAKVILSEIASVEDKTNWVNNRYIAENFDKFYHENIIIGASTSVDLDAKYLSQKAGNENAFLNFSNGGTRLDYVYFLVQKIIKNNEKRPKKIYFTLVPDWTEVESTKCEEKGGSLVKYFLTKEEVAELDEINGQNGACLRGYENTRFLHKFYFDKFSFKAIKTNAQARKELEENNGQKKSLLANESDFSADKHATTYSFNSFQDKAEWFEPAESYKKMMKKLLKLLAENNIDYEFYFTPHYKEISFFSLDSTNLGFGNYFSLLEKIPPQKISNKILILDNIYFRDSGMHTTLAGAKLFNDYFFDYVVSNEQPKGRIFVADISSKDPTKKITYNAKTLGNGPDLPLPDGRYEFTIKYSAKPGALIELLGARWKEEDKAKARLPRIKKFEKEIIQNYFCQKISGKGEIKRFIKIKNLVPDEIIEIRGPNAQIESVTIKHD